jgi:hypothetical protein
VLLHCTCFCENGMKTTRSQSTTTSRLYCINFSFVVSLEELLSTLGNQCYFSYFPQIQSVVLFPFLFRRQYVHGRRFYLPLFFCALLFFAQQTLAFSGSLGAGFFQSSRASNNGFLFPFLSFPSSCLGVGRCVCLFYCLFSSVK